jgi:Zinc finger C-x8-C-x5-C-x3-H type (and similar)
MNGGFDSAENIRGPIHTPSKTKKATEPIMQLHDSSPLESSDTSLDSRPSPTASDERLALANHSRVSSADTIASTQLSGSSHTLASSALGLKIGSEQRDRPHSYSGGLSTADLQRLRGAGASPPDGERASQWSTAVDRQNQYDQPLYPSLSSYPRQSVAVTEDLQVDYTTQQRQFQPLDGSIPSPQAFNGRSNGSLNGAANHRSQPARGYNPGHVTNGTYPGAPGHTAHLSLGNTQQVYDMMMPPHENLRIQQQPGTFRGTHQHSTSDPLHLREAAALLSTGLPPFQPGLYPPSLAPPAMGLYPNQFYAPHEAYATAGVAAQVMAAARLQSPFHTAYGLPGQSISPGLGGGGQASASSVDLSGNGPSANNRKLGLYKTELCRSWEEKGTCRYGPKCQFAHGEEEIRKVSRHPKVIWFTPNLSPILTLYYLLQYKTEICRVCRTTSFLHFIC